MAKLPNIAGEYSSYEFDRDAQGAYEFYFKINQVGDKVSIFYRVFNPYDRKTRETIIKGRIIGFDERIHTVKILDDNGKYHLFDYEKGNFAEDSYMNVVHFDIDKTFSLQEKFELLLQMSNFTISGILQQDIEFYFPQKLEQNGLSEPIMDYRLEKKIDIENEDVRLHLITPEKDLFTYKSFITGKRNGEIINYVFAEIQHFPTEIVIEIFKNLKAKLY